MELKDMWIDKIDDVDDASAEDINTIAHAVIELEKNGGTTAKVLDADADLDNLADGWYHLPNGHNSFEEMLGHNYPHTLYQTSSGVNIQEYKTQVSMCAQSIMWRGGTSGVGGGFKPWQKLSLNVIDNLTSTDTTSPLSANQGRLLNDKIGDIETLLGGI